HQRGPARAVDDALPEPHDLRLTERPHLHRHLGVVGDDVDGRTAVLDNAAHTHIGCDVLTQGVHAGEGKHGGVGRVDALVGRLPGVRRLAVEAEVDPGLRDVRVAHHDLVVAVPHDRDVGGVEHAALDHVDLPPAALLEGAAHDVDV